MTGKLENFLQDAENIDAGTDSIVYKPKSDNCVIKVYHNLRMSRGKCFCVEDCLEIVQRYNSATLKAKQVIDSLWNNSSDDFRSITLGEKSYTVNVNILPQGEPIIIGEEVVSIGQQYIPFASLLQIYKYDPNDNHFEKDIAVFYDAINKERPHIRKMLDSATELILNKLEVPFFIVNTNVKPHLDESSKTLNLIVTDIASSIVRNYVLL